MGDWYLNVTVSSLRRHHQHHYLSENCQEKQTCVHILLGDLLLNQ